MRSALFQIWFDRDYTQYATLTNNSSLTLENWQPSNRFRLYIRKDIVNKFWQYGVKAAEVETGRSLRTGSDHAHRRYGLWHDRQ